MTHEHLLELLIFTPIGGGLLVLLAGNQGVAAKRLALITALLSCLLALLLYHDFEPRQDTLQFVVFRSWLPTMQIYYHLGIDGIALPLLLLTCFISLLAVLHGWDVKTDRPAHYLAALLIMQGLVIGVFCAVDAVLFYLFWEASLIPMFLLIGIWGGPRRIYASFKFFLYTFFGSVLMLIALVYLYLQADSFSLPVWHRLPLSLSEQQWLFWAFLLAFAVKIPMWPVHTWLPDAHVEAPTGGSVILAALMLKLGGYGLIRFSMPIAPDAALYFAPLVIALSLIAIIYIGLVALVQQDMKKLIAYSSIAHMGFVTLGLFAAFGLLGKGQPAMARLGMEGAMVQMISHGFISAALFFCVGSLYDRIHSRQIDDYGGLAAVWPLFSAFALLFAMANAGLPGTSGFVGEFMVILASFSASPLYALLAATTLVLGAGYTLWMLRRLIFGPVVRQQLQQLTTLSSRERIIYTALAIAILGTGLWPQWLTEIMHDSIRMLAVQLSAGKL